jgi:hypothetical protein
MAFRQPEPKAGRQHVCLAQVALFSERGAPGVKAQPPQVASAVRKALAPLIEGGKRGDPNFRTSELPVRLRLSCNVQPPLH